MAHTATKAPRRGAHPLPPLFFEAQRHSEAPCRPLLERRVAAPGGVEAQKVANQILGMRDNVQGFEIKPGGSHYLSFEKLSKT